MQTIGQTINRPKNGHTQQLRKKSAIEQTNDKNCNVQVVPKTE